MYEMTLVEFVTFILHVPRDLDIKIEIWILLIRDW